MDDAERKRRAAGRSDGGDLSRSPLWRDLLRHYAVSDIASAVYRDRFGCWGFLDLWRVGPAGRFGVAEASFLDAIARPVTAALRRSLASTSMCGTWPKPIPPGPIVLLLSRDLEVRAQTPETQRYLRMLVPPAPDQPPVPAGAYNVAAQRWPPRREWTRTRPWPGCTCRTAGG